LCRDSLTIVSRATIIFVGEGEWTVFDLESEISERALCATATAAALAIATPDSCLAAGVVYADVGEGTCPPPSEDSADSADAAESDDSADSAVSAESGVSTDSDDSSDAPNEPSGGDDEVTCTKK
jgi:hypothetical protein